MHVAILGAGALGRVYGTRLACETAERVTFVVRHGHKHGAPYRLHRVDHGGAEHVLGDPERATAVPATADVVLVCVRAEQLGEAADAVAGVRGAIVTLTPLMPEDHDALRARLGDRLVAGMPGVVAYFAPDGHVRYWLPRVAATLIEDHVASAHDGAIGELARALDVSGVPARRERGVHEINAATTITFMPLTMGIAAAGGVDPLLADEPLLELAIAAAKESAHLAEQVGRAAHWAESLVHFVNPGLIKVGVGIARHSHAEAVRYVDQHFGSKLRAQSVAMGRKLSTLAKARGVPSAAIEALEARLEASVGGAA